MARSGAGHITLLLAQWQSGDREAQEQLIKLVYVELHRLARRYMRGEARNHSLQTTALVNEAYLQLTERRNGWKNRAQFFGVAATSMRRILIDHARRNRAAKRGDGKPQANIDDLIAQDSPVAAVPLNQTENLIAIDEALTRLGDVDARQVQIVEMRFFAGMTSREIAQALQISERTVDREWAAAQAWLYRHLRSSRDEPGRSQ